MFSRVSSMLLLMVLAANVMVASSDVFTSMNRIKDMVLNERNILNKINEALPQFRNVKSEFLRFYEQRIRNIETRNMTKEMERLNHPNGAYSIIQEFAKDYERIRSTVAEANGDLANWYIAQIADADDVMGARLSLLRLQEVYNLKTRDMAKGLYLRLRGPALNSSDAFLVGQAAFQESMYRQSAQWLETALALRSAESKEQEEAVFDPDDINQFGKIGASSKTNKQRLDSSEIMGLLGRSYFRLGDEEKAAQMYQDARKLDFRQEEVVALGQELHRKPAPYKENRPEELDSFYRLCAQRSKLTGKYTDPRLRCRTHAVHVPYYRFNEEIVSNTPYVSLFYDVISDREAEFVKDYSGEKLYRGGVVGPAGNTMTKIRTSNIAFLEDHESPVVKSVSDRITQLTGLETAPNPDGFYKKKQSAAEPLQVVNYGIGGYYSVHMDPYDHLNDATENILLYSGNRLATFLIYLTDVERGGSTAFPLADLVVPPVKKNAVFWYSYTPDGELDGLTRHAGCPVMVGEKWIINKWVLTYGNTFSRRCGLTKNATQLDIEKDMMRGYRPRRTKKTKRHV